MARLIDQISSHRPAAIVIDILYTERSNTEAVFTRDRFAEIQPYLYHVLSGEELRIQTREGTRVIGPGNPGFDLISSGAASAKSQDLELADAVRRAVDDGIPVILAAQTVSGKQVVGLSEPYPELTAAGGTLGLVGIRLDRDGVLRRYLPYGQDKEGRFVYGMALEAVAKFQDAGFPDRPMASGDVPLIGGSMVKAPGGQFLVNFRGAPGTYLTLEAGDVLRDDETLQGGEDYSAQLNGKIVFIGATDPSAEDLHPTPYSGTRRMSGVEFHAAAADTILSDSFIQVTPRYLRIILVALLAIAAMALGRFPRPVYGFSGAVVVLGSLSGGWFGLFMGTNFLLPLAGPLTAMVVGYGFALTDRVGVEQLEKQQARSMLSRYLPPDIVKEMLKNPIDAQLGSRRAELTVLFSDIRGFTSLSERLDPEIVVDLLNQYLTEMTEIIFRHGGTVDKFEGDGILVFFGAPQLHADHPERAVRTALEMRDRLTELQSSWREQSDEPLRIGVAINTGEVMVGNIGSSRRMDYTVIGDTVNLAARLQDLTKEFGASVLISGSTQERIKHMFQLRDLGSVEVRGRQQHVDLYEVENLSAETDAPSPETTPIQSSD
jgi:adenylate cyclase